MKTPILVLVVAVLAASASLALDVPGSARDIALNDNRTPAGVLDRGVLTVALVANRGVWYPEGKEAPGLDVEAFAVDGRTPTAPGPLLRVPAGTELRVSVRNELLLPLTVHGLGAARLVVSPGATGRATFIARAPGTSFYWATTTGAELGKRNTDDSELNGAIVVDPPGARASDRIFVLSHHYNNQFEVWAINGASWPATERLFYTVGDAVRWRWINASDEEHPLHLHGHYFRVDDDDRLVATQVVASGAARILSWVPDRAGNWLFHCHILFHVAPELHLAPPMSEHDMHDPLHHMAGLVLGITVAPRPGVALSPDSTPVRRLRLVVGERPGVRYGDVPGLGYAVAESDAGPAEVTAPGTPIVLARGQPVEIIVENRLATATSVHWHGIELESYYDGVPGWTGSEGHLSPAIEPGGTFVARFAPPRAGTFIYHTHLDDYRQLSTGLYGALIVVDPATAYDPATDKVFVFSSDGVDNDVLVINGSVRPAPLELMTGVTYRLRFVGITPADNVTIALTRDGTPVTWRALAKDGADLPITEQTDIPAQLSLAPGETYDFALRIDSPADLRLAAIELVEKANANVELLVR